MVQATSIGSTGQIFGTGLGFLIPTLIVDSKVDNFENDVNATTEAFEENFGIRDQLIILFSGTTGENMSFTWIFAEKSEQESESKFLSRIFTHYDLYVHPL